MVKDLDIFDRVGHSTAHDEIIPMSIRKGKLSVQGEVSTFTGKLYVEFVKVTVTVPLVEGRWRCLLPRGLTVRFSLLGVL